MKKKLTEKDLNQIIVRFKKAEYVVNTTIPGSVNMALVELDGKSSCQRWKTKNKYNESYNYETPKHVKLYAYGSSKNAEVLIMDYGENASDTYLIGKGKEGYAKVLIIQYIGEEFTVVWNSDLPEQKAMFFMSATDKNVIEQLIILMAEKFFPAINKDVIQKSITLLMEGSDDE